MGFNSGKIKVQSTAKKTTSPWSKDALVQPYPIMEYGGEGDDDKRGPHKPFMEGPNVPSLASIKKAIRDNENNSKTATPIETEKTIIGYDQAWDGEKWVQTPIYENIPRRVVNRKYDDGGMIPMYPHGGDHDGIQFPIYQDQYDFMERQSDTKKVLAPGESKESLGKPMFFEGDNGVEYVCTEKEGCTARANRAIESLMPGTSYFENPVTTKKSINAMYSAAGQKIPGQKNPVFTPTPEQIKQYPYLEGDIESGSLDAWDIIPQFQRTHPENVIFSAVHDDPNQFRKNKKFAKDVWKEYDIPIGAYINVGDVSDTGYTKRKGDVAGSHTARVVGFKDDGEPLIADYGRILPLSEVQYSHASDDEGGIAGIASVPGKEKYTYKYFKQQQEEMNKPSTTTYLKPAQLEGKSDEYKGYHNTISKQKNYLKTALGLTDKQYDEYAEIALTLPGQETDFGTGDLYSMVKKPLSSIGAVESEGPAQLREKNVADKYARILSKFKDDDEAYNAAAVITYIKELDNQRKGSKGWAAKGEKAQERPWVRPERSMLDPVDTAKQLATKGLRKVQGKEDFGYIYGDSGPDVFAYSDKNDKRQEIELPYKTPFDSDEEYATEVNALLKKKNPDLRFEFDKKGRRVIYAKTKGNMPEIKKNLKDFVFYSWQSPSAVRYGDAQGKSTYYQKNLENYKKLFKKQLGGEASQDNLKQNVMANNIPEGWHLMPETGQIMRDEDMNYRQGGAPCYECGGHIGAYEMGGSTAPQNANINSIGKSQTEMMKNYLAKNVMTDLINKEKQALEQQHQQMMQQFEGGGNTGSVYNPELYNQSLYQDTMTKNKWDRDQDYGNLMKGLIEVGVNQEMRNAQNQGPTAPVSNFNQNFTSPASMQFSGAPEGTTQGVDPNTGFQSSFAPGANPYMNMGGGLPMAQNGLNFDVPSAHLTPERIARYRAENPNMPMWGEMEGSRDPATGYWNRVALDWSKPWAFGASEEEQMYTDPRQIQAQKNLIPGGSYFGVGDDMGPLDYLNNAWQMPQKGVNKWLTGYYEAPTTTFERYNERIDPTAKFWLDVISDPMMYPELPIIAGKAAYKTGVKGLQKAAPYVKKGLLQAEKAAVYTAEKAVQASKYVAEKVGPQAKALLKRWGPLGVQRILQAGSHNAEDAEQNKAFLERAVRDEIKKLNLVPRNTLPSSTIQQPVAPPSGAMAVTPNQDINNMTLEELQAITGMRRYGGDALPKADNGTEVPLMMQKYWNPEQIAQARNRQAVLQGNQWAADIANPFSNLFGNSSDPQAAADAIEQGCFPGMDCFPTEAATTGSTAGTTGAGKSKGTKGAGKTETPTTGTTTTTTPTTTTQSGPRKGNYEGTEGSEGTGYYDPNYYNRGYNYGNYENYGYNPGRTKTKMWVVDPETGKRRKIYKHKTDGRGGYGGYSGGRRGYPRVIRNQYDFYQNPIFTQQGALQPQPPAPGTVVNPETGTTPGVAPGADASMAAVPLAFTDPIAAAQQRPTPPMDAGMGVLAQVPSPYAPGYGPWSDVDPYADVTAEGLSTLKDFNNPNYGGGNKQGRGMGIFSGRNKGVNPERTARVERRFQRQLARDEARGYAYGGQPNYFEPGGEWNDPNNAVPDWIKNPSGEYGVGQTPNTGNAPYAMTDQGQKTLGLETKQKFSGQGDGFAQYAPLVPGAVGTFGNIAGELFHGDQRKLDAQALALTSASNTFTPKQLIRRGSAGVINTGEQVDTTIAQNPGNNQGMFGSPDYFSRYGGQPQYANGGEYYLDEDQIAQLRAGGAVIEYL